jgi:hypothetical protein
MVVANVAEQVKQEAYADQAEQLEEVGPPVRLVGPLAMMGPRAGLTGLVGHLRHAMGP